MINKKGVSPVIAILLLIVIATTSALILYVWLSGDNIVSKESAEKEASRLTMRLKIEGVQRQGNYLIVYVRNMGDVKAKVDKAYLEKGGVLVHALDSANGTVVLEPRKSYKIVFPLPENLEAGTYALKIGSTSGVSATINVMGNVLKAGGTLTGWSYRRQITITENSGFDLSSFQVKIVLTPTNFDYSHVNTDGSDIRFTLSDGVTTIPYWIEDWNYGGTSIIWVKVPSIPASGTATIYMYYGKSDATSESNGLNVFDFFDDFDDLDVSDWTSVDATISAVFFAGERTLGLWPGTLTYFKHFAVPTNLNLGLDRYVVEARLWDDNPAGSVLVHYLDDDWWWGIELYAGRHIFRPYIAGSDKGWVIVTYNPVISDAWYKIKVVTLPDHLYVYINDGLQGSWPIAPQYQFSGYNKVGIVEHRGYGPIYCDYIFVRKYAPVEPSVDIGPEESL